MLTFRTSIQLPQCLKVISYLRRLDIFQENDLRLKFLQVPRCFFISINFGLLGQSLIKFGHSIQSSINLGHLGQSLIKLGHLGKISIKLVIRPTFDQLGSFKPQFNQLGPKFDQLCHSGKSFINLVQLSNISIKYQIWSFRPKFD